MAFTQVTVTGAFESADGDPARGRIRFTPEGAMTNDGVTVVAAPVTATLDGGQLTVSLAANTDPDTTPADTTYLVEELLAGQRSCAYRIALGHGDYTQDLVEVIGAGYPVPDGWGLMPATFTETF